MTLTVYRILEGGDSADEIIYKQEMTYVAHDEFNEFEIVYAPFSTEEDQERYIAALQELSPDYNGLHSVEVYYAFRGEEESLSRAIAVYSTIFVVVGLLGVILLACAVVYVVKKLRNRGIIINRAEDNIDHQSDLRDVDSRY